MVKKDGFVDSYGERGNAIARRSFFALTYPAADQNLACIPRHVFCQLSSVVFTLMEKTISMIRKSKQLIAEEIKTVDIIDLAKLRFKMLKPYEGVIEVVNRADQGRVCTLIIGDFASVQDAQVYGQLLVLAPQLLSACLTDAEKLVQVVERYKNFREAKGRQKNRIRKSDKKG